MQDNRAVTGKIGSTFMAYVIPTIIGMLALSSASIMDGIFVGNRLGYQALAAVNLSLPIISTILGFTIFLAAGGDAICGKLIGERKFKEVRELFTKIMAILMAFSLVFALIGLWQVENIASVLGADASIIDLVIEYLRYIFMFMPVVTIGFALSIFVRLDGKPLLSAIALVSAAILNIGLDYLFIYKLDMGIAGASLATCLAWSCMLLILLPHFLLKKGIIHLTLPSNWFKGIGHVLYNGSSEFLNEVSGGVLLLLINIFVNKRYGVDGVAAFSVINYFIVISVMVGYAVGDSLKPLISVNWGANKHERIYKFLYAGYGFVLGVGVILMGTLWLFPSQLIALFLDDTSSQVGAIAKVGISFILPLFLFNGITIVITAYFTAFHKPIQSASIAICRTMIMPVCMIYILTQYFGSDGVFMALPVAELFTFVIALVLFYQHKQMMFPKSSGITKQTSAQRRAA